MPIGPTDSVQRVTSEGFTTFPMKAEPVVSAESEYGNRFAYFEFDYPKGAQIIQHRCRVTTPEVLGMSILGRSSFPTIGRSPFSPYLRRDSAVSISHEIESVLARFSSRPAPGFGGLLDAIDWVDANA